MKSQIETITPKRAMEYLENNISNRKLDMRHIEFLARQMTNGSWIDNGDSIKFTESGVLSDGQHRLYAIAKSGKPQTVVVVKNLHEDAFKTIDVDRKPRNLSTIFDLEGFKNTTALAAILRMVSRFLPDGNYSENFSRLSTADAEEILQSFPELFDWARIYANSKLFATSPLANSMLVGCAIIFGRSNWGRTSPLEFVKMVATGEGLNKHDPALTLRNRVLRVRMSGATPARKETIGMIIKAWNYEQEGKPLSSISPHAQLQRVRALPKDWANPKKAEHPE